MNPNSKIITLILPGHPSAREVRFELYDREAMQPIDTARRPGAIMFATPGPIKHEIVQRRRRRAKHAADFIYGEIMRIYAENDTIDGDPYHG